MPDGAQWPGIPDLTAGFGAMSAVNVVLLYHDPLHLPMLGTSYFTNKHLGFSASLMAVGRQLVRTKTMP